MGVFEPWFSSWTTRRSGWALSDYTEAIRLEPGFAPAFYNRGIAREPKGDFDGALEDLSEAIRLEPTYTDALFSRALVLHVKRKHSAALADYQRFLDLGGGVDDGRAAEAEKAIRELQKTMNKRRKGRPG